MISREEVKFLINRKANVTFYDTIQNTVIKKEIIIFDVNEAIATFEGDGFNCKRAFINLFHYHNEDNIRTSIKFDNMLKVDLIDD